MEFFVLKRVLGICNGCNTDLVCVLWRDMHLSIYPVALRLHRYGIYNILVILFPAVSA